MSFGVKMRTDSHLLVKKCKSCCCLTLLLLLCLEVKKTDSQSTTIVPASVISIGYKWKTSKWSDCLVSDRLCLGTSSSSLRDTSFGSRPEPVFGTRSRHVWCSNFSGDEGDQHREEHHCKEPRPLSTSSCTTFCARTTRGCLPGPWSSWSPCTECFGKQFRQRSLSCSRSHPIETQERTCISPSHCSLEKQDYSSLEEIPSLTPLALMTRSRALQATSYFRPYLYIGPWSECVPQDKTGDEVGPGKKRLVKRGEHERNRKQKRPRQFPLWSFEQPSHQQQQHHRHRSKRQAGPPRNWPPEFPPSDLDLVFSSASSAATSPTISHVASPHHGTQTRDVKCRGQDGEELPLRVCMDGRYDTMDVQSSVSALPSLPTLPKSLLTIRSCIVPVKCKTTQWSQWRLESNCSQRMRRLVRDRSILRPPQGEGRPCPHLTEFKQGHDLDVTSEFNATKLSTNEKCKDPFVLVASSWSECIVTDSDGNAATCGGGLQDRNITCMKGETQQPVDITVCSHLTQLPRVQRCFVPCVDTCRVGPWSEWTSCIPKDCSQSSSSSSVSGKQTRHRKVESASITLSACPHLEESRDCSVSSCFSWKLAQKDPCFLPKGRSCGKGTRKLFFSCADHQGVAAKVESCSNLRPPPFEEPCQALCPGECVVSEWTEWGTCPTVCFKRDRLPLVYRNRTVLALGSSNTGPNDDCSNLSEVKVCREEDCDVHHWQAGLWGLCRPTETAQDGNCGRGVRTRDVICVSKSTENRVPEWRCNGLAQPVLQQSCFRPCPQDCQLTEWSEWSSCLQNCDQSTFNIDSSASFTVITNTQTRYRRVLQWPRDGGKACQTLIDVRPCPLLGTSCGSSSYSWKPDGWSQCYLPDGLLCGQGIRTRGLQCTKGGVKSDVSLCLDLPTLNILPQVEPCIVDCQTGCIKGPWTDWSSCSQSCPSIRSRKRIIHQKGNPVGGCRTNSSHPMESIEEEPCSCQQFHSVPGGQWSQCILEGTSQSASQSASHTQFCGIGKRYRRLDCLDSSNQITDIKHCGKEPYEEESCIVACPTDCHMSTWSEWGLCDAICGAGLKNRTSKVLRLASVGGRPCPGPSVQYATCNYPCESFQWVTSGWSECNPIDKKQSCGKGTKTRNIRCVEKISGRIEVDVPGSYCDPAALPSEEEDCRLFCPEECVVSEWTEWSSCLSDDCLRQGVQRRNRSILRKADCHQHPLDEQRSCDEKCFFRYEWRLTPWSSCRPVGDSACGEGRRFRGAKCVRISNGRPVKESFCDLSDRPAELESRCPMDCPIDCEVSPWTEWDETSCRCGRRQFNMTRTRVVTTEGSPTGRPCPFSLSESKPCPSVPCYKWVRSQWTCDLQGAECGIGVAHRNVTCERSGSNNDNSKESTERCLSTLFESMMPTTLLSTISDRLSMLKMIDASEVDTCFKSCPPDCVLSDWTAWSECKGKCIGEQTIGSRTRERRIVRDSVRPHGQCLSDLKETSICLAEACFTFSFVNIAGKTECSRSDGIIVQANDCYSNGLVGFDGHEPGQLQQGLYPCDPPCDVPFSECSSELKCVCRRGHLPTFLPAPILSSRLPKLIYCSPDPYYKPDMSSQNMSQIIGKVTVADINKDNGTAVQYYPNDSELNHWMLAMIGIGCIFIAFVGVSIYLMCKSNSAENAARAPKERTTA